MMDISILDPHCTSHDGYYYSKSTFYPNCACKTERMYETSISSFYGLGVGCCSHPANLPADCAKVSCQASESVLHLWERERCRIPWKRCYRITEVQGCCCWSWLLPESAVSWFGASWRPTREEGCFDCPVHEDRKRAGHLILTFSKACRELGFDLYVQKMHDLLAVWELQLQCYSFGSDCEKTTAQVFELPRSTAEELMLSSVFALVAVSNVRAACSPVVYATDAPMQRGAVTARPVSPDIARMLIWLGGDKKGTYTALDPPFRALRRSFEIDLEELEGEKDKSPASLEFQFSFVEVCGVVGSVSKALAAGVDRLWLR